MREEASQMVCYTTSDSSFRTCSLLNLYLQMRFVPVNRCVAFVPENYARGLALQSGDHSPTLLHFVEDAKRENSCVTGESSRVASEAKSEV